MQKVPIWKPLVVLAAIVLSVLSLYPPSQRLKLGLDLAGGTTLVYSVNLPEGADASRDIEDTIAVLRNRVDPNGVRNLVWRRVGADRIEIQMAHASSETKERREKYLAARDAVFTGNISKLQLDAALRAASQNRPAILNQLAGDNPGRRKLLADLAQASDVLNAARSPYESAQQRQKQVEAMLAKLPADARADQRHDLEQELAAAQAELTARTRAFLDARKQYESLRDTVLATNVESAELERVLNLTDKADDKGVNLRQAALDALIQSHPNRAEQIREVAAKNADYEKLKGPLDDPNDLIQLLRGSGVLEFRIAPAPAEVSDLAQIKEQLRTRGPRGLTDKRYKWLPIDQISRFADTPSAQERLKANPEAFFESLGTPMVAQKYGDQIYILLANTPEASLTHQQSGWSLTRAMIEGDAMGYPGVGFELNPVGGDLMGQLTGEHKGKPMAIVLDEKIMSAPRINDRITTRGIITGGHGGFSRQDLDYLVRTLKAGSLKAQLSSEPISIQTTGATFGIENLHAGLRSAVWALILVGGFMLVYYFLLGMVANFALVLNILLVLGAMAMLEATFTLSGIAGVILTIGMAVDANVLIYERIREELERKLELKRAVQLGFQKALATIIDANLTTLITCLILGYTATADVKGFAVTLGIGLVANIFTAVFCTHVVIDLYTDIMKPKTIQMLPIAVPAVRRFFSPNIDWVGKKGLYIGISAVLTIGGMIGIYLRGQDFLDIEFRSGTQITFSLGQDAQGRQKMLTTEEVRQRLVKASQTPGLEKLAEATPVTVGQTEGDKASAFTIQTLVTDAKAVSNAIKTTFADVLDVQRPVQFAGMDLGSASVLTGAPVYPIREGSLGSNIHRPNVREDVAEYLGGVAIVLNDLTPACSVEQITQRISRMASQPEFEVLGYRPVRVIGLDLAEAATAPAGQPLYRSVVVITRDDRTNYADNPENFSESSGLAATQWKLVTEALRRDTSLAGVTNFSSQVSSTMKQQAIVAVILSWVAIALYIWIRFGSLAYGLGAILALIHDCITAVGLAALAFYVYDTPIGHALLLAPFRVDLAMVAAVLTLIGYSVNDTIVVFDRIRENRGKLAYATPAVINDSINQTISRTVLTVATVLVAVLALYVLGGPGVHGFAFVMLVGALVGCYSSIAVASPLLLLIKHTPEQEKKSAPKPGTSPAPAR